MSHDLSDTPPAAKKSKKDISQSQESWAKRDDTKPPTARSKYFSPPETVPAPRIPKSKVIKKHQNLGDEKKTGSKW